MFSVIMFSGVGDKSTSW